MAWEARGVQGKVSRIGNNKGDRQHLRDSSASTGPTLQAASSPSPQTPLFPQDTHLRLLKLLQYRSKPTLLLLHRCIWSWHPLCHPASLVTCGATVVVDSLGVSPVSPTAPTSGTVSTGRSTASLRSGILCLSLAPPMLLKRSPIPLLLGHHIILPLPLASFFLYITFLSLPARKGKSRLVYLYLCSSLCLVDESMY